MSNKNSIQKPKEKLIDKLSTFREWGHSLREFKFQNELLIYRFSLPELSVDENLKISNRVNDYHNECGCKSGSLFMILTLIITVSTYFIYGGNLSSITLYGIIWCISIILFAAFAGKGIGLLYARWKLIRLSQNLQRRLKII